MPRRRRARFCRNPASSIREASDCRVAIPSSARIDRARTTASPDRFRDARERCGVRARADAPGRSCRATFALGDRERDQENDDFSRLLRRAEDVAGLTVQLPTDKFRNAEGHKADGDRRKQHRAEM